MTTLHAVVPSDTPHTRPSNMSPPLSPVRTTDPVLHGSPIKLTEAQLSLPRAPYAKVRWALRMFLVSMLVLLAFELWLLVVMIRTTSGQSSQPFGVAAIAATCIAILLHLFSCFRILKLMVDHRAGLWPLVLICALSLVAYLLVALQAYLTVVDQYTPLFVLVPLVNCGVLALSVFGYMNLKSIQVRNNSFSPPQFRAPPKPLSPIDMGPTNVPSSSSAINLVESKPSTASIP